MTTPQYLILVDQNDAPTGKMEKMEVHEKGLLHRAFSVFIFNSKGELLLQQRANEKYHSAGLWTNTCCSHPEYGEEVKQAIDRRLQEEMGMHTDTTFAFSFLYHATFENGLTEHELDHVYFGISDETPIPNAHEVQQWKYLEMEALAQDLLVHPNHYTAWLKICFEKIKKHYQETIVPNLKNTK